MVHEQETLSFHIDSNENPYGINVMGNFTIVTTRYPQSRSYYQPEDEPDVETHVDIETIVDDDNNPHTLSPMDLKVLPEIIDTLLYEAYCAKGSKHSYFDV